MEYTIPTLPGVIDSMPCTATVSEGRIHTQLSTLYSSTLSISAGSAFHPLEAPGKPILKMPSSSTHRTVPMLSLDWPRHPNLTIEYQIIREWQYSLAKQHGEISAALALLSKTFDNLLGYHIVGGHALKVDLCWKSTPITLTWTVAAT
jgi:hypothetical protein